MRTIQLFLEAFVCFRELVGLVGSALVHITLDGELEDLLIALLGFSFKSLDLLEGVKACGLDCAVVINEPCRVVHSNRSFGSLQTGGAGWRVSHEVDLWNGRAGGPTLFTCMPRRYYLLHY